LNYVQNLGLALLGCGENMVYERIMIDVFGFIQNVVHCDVYDI
jgi:hypothetical protein